MGRVGKRDCTGRGSGSQARSRVTALTQPPVPDYGYAAPPGVPGVCQLYARTSLKTPFGDQSPVRSILLFAASGLALAAVLGACDDPTRFQIKPQIFTDTVQLAASGAPGADSLPTALDISVQGNGVVGGRFPERLSDAGQWDFLVRVQNGALVLVPSGALGIESRAGAALIQGANFDALRDVPKKTTFRTDSATTIVNGAVYVLRSRYFANGISTCQQYAKVQPLAVDAAVGRVTLRVATNAVCGDQRLVSQE